MPNKPTVMVSSTFYDLKQIRRDLAQFIEDQMRYNVLVSEMSSFPIDPDVDTIENCRRRVERDADVLILVIGGRYGSVDSKTAKSITNIEYLAARQKKIPIYVFLDKRVEANLPIWEKNKNADFSGAVDTTQLFEFVQQVRSTDRVWMQGFDTAQDIVAGLEAQFAYLMKEGLDWRLQVRQRSYEDALKDLGGKAFRIALERPPAWEYILFGQVIVDEVAKADRLQREFRLGISLGPGELVKDESIIDWTQTQVADYKLILATLNKVMAEPIQEALGAPGQPGSVDDIVFVASTIGNMHRQAMEWSQRIRRASVPDEFLSCFAILAHFPEDMVSRIEEYGHKVISDVDSALLNTGSGQLQVVEATLVAHIPDEILEEFDQGFNQASKAWLSRHGL